MGLSAFVRKLIVANIVSLDGFFSGPGGNVTALPFAAGFSEYNAERLRQASTLLLGRSSFEGFRDYWPSIAEDEDQPEVEREISRLNSAIEKVVISDSLTDDALGPWSNTEIVPRSDAHERVTALKQEGDGDILVFGSHVLWNDLMAAGLVDELHLMVGPGVIGSGIPAFESAESTRLKPLGAELLPDSELVLLRYRPL